MNSNNPITAQLLITMLADGNFEVTRTGDIDTLLSRFTNAPNTQPSTTAAQVPTIDGIAVEEAEA